ncbi:MAG: tRNA (adenosine(37)-N6)-dimethylallyltransferase MiaA [Lachnospiraceae bacterium]|nr:tRNA (adenosine(37)-N6)-dimethylallyltransferase MiaA [Lachnospiraceae bacterium]
MKKTTPLIILAGPTAVGKSAHSVELSRRIGGSVISADSMQVYRGMDIGSAKIKPIETKGIPHYLIDILDPVEDFHVVKFQALAKEAMAEIAKNGRIPVLCGGTGFYIQALLYNIDFTTQEKDEALRNQLLEFARKEGNEALHQRLFSIDPEAAYAIPVNNVKRVIRAIEFYEASNGRRISEHNRNERAKPPAYPVLYLVLNEPRERLYQKIDERVEHMLQEGLVEEVRTLLESGVSMQTTAMQGLGYKETAAYLNGELTLEEAVRRIKRDSRHFAKRQLTWFKREPLARWIQKETYSYDENAVADQIEALARDFLTAYID